MSHPNVRGVVVLTRGADRFGYAQDPNTYKSSHTECTPLGEVQSHGLGKLLRAKYFNPSSPSYIDGIGSDLVDLDEIQVRVKNGGEGRVVFDSTIALLQGLFPPTEKNSIELANETRVVAPLGGYQYIPVETVEPSNDRSLESWTDCPNFEKHIKAFYSSDMFKEAEKQSSRFFADASDFMFGRPSNFLNAHNVYDYMFDQLTHNKSYAHRLPPTYIEQARHWANVHEQGIFSDKDMSSIGNIASRTLMSAAIESLQRITFDGDPVQFILHATTYQPFISLFSQTEIPKSEPDIFGIPDFASALAIELRRGALPDNRDFLRFLFKNGTEGQFEPVHVFDHPGDIPLTEFIYRIEGSLIPDNKQWARTCGSSSFALELPEVNTATNTEAIFYGAMLALALLLFSALFSRALKGRQASKRVRLPLTAEEPMQQSRTRSSMEKQQFI